MESVMERRMDTVETDDVTTEKPVVSRHTENAFEGCWPASVGLSDFTVHIPSRDSRANTTEQLE